MGLTPTQKAVIGQFTNGRNSTDDFLQLVTNNGGTVFGWIDSNGTLQGSLASSAVGIGGSISIGQVAVGTGPNVVGGTSSFTYNAGTQTLSTSTFSGTTFNGTTFNGTTFGGTTFNAVTGFQIGGTAASGQFLRGNGTNFVSSGIQTGDVLWHQLGSATGALAISNAANPTTFNQSTAAQWSWINTTAATNVLNQDSPRLILSGQYWTGSASATQSWQIQATAANGLVISEIAGAAPASSLITFQSQVQINSQVQTTGAGIFSFLSDASGEVFSISSCGNASGGLTVYQATIPGAGQPLLGQNLTITGFTNGVNNGTFVVQSATLTSVTVYNGAGVSETHAATGTVNGPYFNDSGFTATFGFTRNYIIQGVTYQAAGSLSADPFFPQLILNAKGDAKDSAYMRIINDGATGNHGLEIGSIIDGTGAAPVLFRAGVFGGISSASVNVPFSANTFTVSAATPTGAAGQISIGNTTATSATAGANGATPAQVAGYLTIDVAGTKQKVPYYNV